MNSLSWLARIDRVLRAILLFLIRGRLRLASRELRCLLLLILELVEMWIGEVVEEVVGAMTLKDPLLLVLVGVCS